MYAIFVMTNDNIMYRVGNGDAMAIKPAVPYLSSRACTLVQAAGPLPVPSCSYLYELRVRVRIYSLAGRGLPGRYVLAARDVRNRRSAGRKDILLSPRTQPVGPRECLLRPRHARSAISHLPAGHAFVVESREEEERDAIKLVDSGYVVDDTPRALVRVQLCV